MFVIRMFSNWDIFSLSLFAPKSEVFATYLFNDILCQKHVKHTEQYLSHTPAFT